MKQEKNIQTVEYREDFFNKILRTFNSIGYVYGFERNYNVEYHCDGECNGGYCRCGTIDSPVIKIDYKTFLIKELELSPNSIFHYCIERLLSFHKTYHPDSYETAIEGGYYGEELGDTSFSNISSLREDLEILFNVENEGEMIRFVLYREYGHLLEDLKNADFEIVTINKNQIVFRNDYFQKVAEIPEYKNWPFPVCLVKQVAPNKYSIIDGFHREKMATGNFNVILKK